MEVAGSSPVTCVFISCQLSKPSLPGLELERFRFRKRGTVVKRVHASRTLFTKAATRTPVLRPVAGEAADLNPEYFCFAEVRGPEQKDLPCFTGDLCVGSDVTKLRRRLQPPSRAKKGFVLTNPFLIEVTGLEPVPPDEIFKSLIVIRCSTTS